MSGIETHRLSSGEVITLEWLLDPENDLPSAVAVALGTNARAGDDDELPDPDSADRRGWWGNLDAGEIWQAWEIGCKLWLLERAKIVDQAAKGGATTYTVERHIQDALQPFVDNGIASAFEVDVQRLDVESIGAVITIYRGPLPAIQLQYQSIWDNIRA